MFSSLNQLRIPASWTEWTLYNLESKIRPIQVYVIIIKIQLMHLTYPPFVKTIKDPADKQIPRLHDYFDYCYINTSSYHYDISIQVFLIWLGQQSIVVHQFF